jgi:hypothetical protein
LLREQGTSATGFLLQRPVKAACLDEIDLISNKLDERLDSASVQITTRRLKGLAPVWMLRQPAKSVAGIQGSLLIPKMIFSFRRFSEQDSLNSNYLKAVPAGCLDRKTDS